MIVIAIGIGILTGILTFIIVDVSVAKKRKRKLQDTLSQLQELIP